MLKRQQNPVLPLKALRESSGGWGDQFLTSQNPDSPPSSQSGFSLIECLLAIIIVSILLSAVAPVIVISVATRVQARRVELATQAAKSFIDGVRSGKLDPSSIAPVALNEVDTNQNFASQRATFAATYSPGSSELDSTNCTLGSQYYPYCTTKVATLYCVDLDGGGCTNTSPRDLIVQAFRSRTTKQAALENVAGFDSKSINKNGYLLGVRVYRADSFDGTNVLKKGSDVGDKKNNKAATFAGGSGNRSAPLVEMTTEIGVQGTSYQNLCDRLGGCQ